jgi:hypothetical protein
MHRELLQKAAREVDGGASGQIHLAKSLNMVPAATALSQGEAKMRLTILFVLVVERNADLVVEKRHRSTSESGH